MADGNRGYEPAPETKPVEINVPMQNEKPIETPNVEPADCGTGGLGNSQPVARP